MYYRGTRTPSMLTRATIAGATLCLLTVMPALAQQSVEAEALARAIQRHYDTVRDFTADFEQTYTGGTLRRRTVERGTVEIRKPGQMRWDYTAPEPKQFISDGQRIYFYVPADKQVRVSEMPADNSAPTPILFLAGRGDLVRDFFVEEVEPPAGLQGVRALRLLPRKPEPEYESLTLVVDRASLQLRQLHVTDSQGGTSLFVFTNLRENTGVARDRFTFRIPRGVDVIKQG
jgi:outer membrane lipoprotein carrier protein